MILTSMNSLHFSLPSPRHGNRFRFHYTMRPTTMPYHSIHFRAQSMKPSRPTTRPQRAARVTTLSAKLVHPLRFGLQLAQRNARFANGRCGRRTTTHPSIHACQGAQEEDVPRTNDKPRRMTMQTYLLNTYGVMMVLAILYTMPQCCASYSRVDKVARDFDTGNLLLSREDILKATSRRVTRQDNSARDFVTPAFKTESSQSLRSIQPC